MSISEDAPCDYFSSTQLLESQLVRFRARPSQSQLDMVVIYTAESISAYFSYLQAGGLPDDYKCDAVDFRLLRFLGVGVVHTRLGPNVPAARALKGNSITRWAAHERTLLEKTRLITEIGCQRLRNGSGFEFRVYLDSFGEHYWRFRRFFVDRLVARVERRGKTFEYRDASTGESVDPSDPFALGS